MSSKASTSGALGEMQVTFFDINELREVFCKIKLQKSTSALKLFAPENDTVIAAILAKLGAACGWLIITIPIGIKL